MGRRAALGIGSAVLVLAACGAQNPPSTSPGSPVATAASSATPVPIVTTSPSAKSEAWTATGSMTEFRGEPTATLLASDRVLVAGGSDPGVVDGSIPGRARSSAELYDPGTGRWTATGSMAEARAAHTATLLGDGDVLVAGGTTRFEGPDLSSAELYDPDTGTWTVTGSMSEARVRPTATLLANGKVLVAGGSTGSPGGTALSSAELYDPDTGRWTVTGSMSEARAAHTATLLADGHVLVVGGSGFFAAAGVIASAELYDPGTGKWTATGGMTEARFGTTATRLADGHVLVAGGSDAQFRVVPSAELYDPGTGTWTVTGRMASVHAGHTATLLADGNVLVAGGRTRFADSGLWESASAELYDPRTGTWADTGSMTGARVGGTATLLADGRVLVVGGSVDSGEPLSSAELYDPGAGS